MNNAASPQATTTNATPARVICDHGRIWTTCPVHGAGFRVLPAPWERLPGLRGERRARGDDVCLRCGGHADESHSCRAAPNRDAGRREYYERYHVESARRERDTVEDRRRFEAGVA